MGDHHDRHQHRHELVDDDEKFELTVDVPGVTEENIDVKVEDGMLTVRGKRTVSSGSSQFTSEFSKSFSLDKTVDVDKIKAGLKNGVLTVSAPKNMKKLEENVRRIPITAAIDAPSPSGESDENATAATGDKNDGSQQKKTEHKDKEEAEKSVVEIDPAHKEKNVP